MADSDLHPKPAGAYVYEILVDGVVRYVGKGRNDRMSAHVWYALNLLKRRDAGEVIRASKFYNGLAKAIKRKASVSSRIVRYGLSDAMAFQIEVDLIAAAPVGKLWNIIRGGSGGDPAFFKKFWSDPNNRARMSEIGKRQWRDPEHRRRGVELLRQVTSAPEFKKFRSEDMKRRFSQDSYRERHAEITRQRWRRDRDALLRQIQQGKERARAKFSAATKKKWQDPEYRAKLCRAQKARWTPAARKKRSETIKAKFAADPTYRVRIAERAKANWGNPGFRERFAAGMAKRNANKV